VSKVNKLKAVFKTIEFISTQQSLELLHIDLFGPVQTASLNSKRYGFVIVDDFSSFTWVLFLKHKDESFEAFQNFCKRVQNEKGSNIITVRSDHALLEKRELERDFREGQNSVTNCDGFRDGFRRFTQKLNCQLLMREWFTHPSQKLPHKIPLTKSLTNLMS